jgi:hypothetical protein
MVGATLPTTNIALKGLIGLIKFKILNRAPIDRNL